MELKKVFEEYKEGLKNVLENSNHSGDSIVKNYEFTKKVAIDEVHTDGKYAEALSVKSDADTVFFLTMSVIKNESEFRDDVRLFRAYYRNELGVDSFLASVSYSARGDITSHLISELERLKMLVDTFNIGYSCQIS